MDRPVNLIKMGGSIITRKNSYRYFRSQVASKIIKEIMEIDGEKIIVHGGGSFGHIKSLEYGIPGEITPKRLAGASLVHSDMLELSSRIAGLFASLGEKPYIFSTSSLFRQGEMDYAEPVSYLRKGLIPLLFGDTYIRGNRVLIYSGDRIMLDLSRQIKPSKVIFFSDVDGVFTDDPKENPEAKLLQRIKGTAGINATGKDATGGMKLKLETMVEVKRYSKEVYIINGRFPERIRETDSADFKGTVIE